MGQPIEFPLNFERYMEMGQLALDEGLLDEALVNFEGAYNLEENFQANLAIVQILTSRSEFIEAKKIADEMKDYYMGDSQAFEEYLLVLLGNHCFIQSRKLVGRGNFLSEKKEQFCQEIQRSEEFFSKFQRKDLNQRLELSRKIPQLTFYQQAKGLKELERLPESDYQTVVGELIEKADLPLLLRNSLLETLVELESTLILEVETIKGKRQIDLGKLRLVSQQGSYSDCLKILEKQQENSESELSRGLREELRLQFTLLYPLGDELVREPDLWVEVFLGSYFNEQVGNLGEEGQGYQELQLRLKNELAELSF